MQAESLPYSWRFDRKSEQGQKNSYGWTEWREWTKALSILSILSISFIISSLEKGIALLSETRYNIAIEKARTRIPVQESSKLADSLSEDRIRQLLAPLQQENAAIDHMHMYKAVVEFSQRLHTLNTVFGDLYSKVSSLEQEIVKQKMS